MARPFQLVRDLLPVLGATKAGKRLVALLTEKREASESRHDLAERQIRAARVAEMAGTPGYEILDSRLDILIKLATDKLFKVEAKDWLAEGLQYKGHVLGLIEARKATGKLITEGQDAERKMEQMDAQARNQAARLPTGARLSDLTAEGNRAAA